MFFQEFVLFCLFISHVTRTVINAYIVLNYCLMRLMGILGKLMERCQCPLPNYWYLWNTDEVVVDSVDISHCTVERTCTYLNMMSIEYL